jgi:hypothetical protein
MILKDYCTERPLLAIEVWSAEVETCNMRPFHPPLRLSIFYGSRDQRPPGSLLPKSKYPGNEVASYPGYYEIVKTLNRCKQVLVRPLFINIGDIFVRSLMICKLAFQIQTFSVNKRALHRNSNRRAAGLRESRKLGKETFWHQVSYTLASLIIAWYILYVCTQI